MRGVQGPVTMQARLQVHVQYPSTCSLVRVSVHMQLDVLVIMVVTSMVVTSMEVTSMVVMLMDVASWTHKGRGY